MTPSARARQVAPSASLAQEAKAAAMKAEGHPVISFAAGEPDFPTPEPIKAAAQRAMAANATHYTAVGGEPALKKAVAERTAELSGLSFEPNQVIATTGAKEALYLAFQATCDAGDEVIIPAPFWVSYAEQVRLAGANPVIVDTDPKDWKLTPELLRRHLSPRTKLLLLCTPSNPTGIVYSEAELAGLAAVLRQHGEAGAMVDEIYARISYVPVGRWLRAAPDLAERTLIVDGVSKAYAMTGWRLGWLVGPRSIVAAAGAIQSHLTSHPSSITQRAALEALCNPDLESTVEQMVRTFRQRRDAIVSGLSGIPGLNCQLPDGAFYVYPDVAGLLGKPLGPNRRVCQTSLDLSSYLLEDALVNAVPGEAFGTPGYLRLSYALGIEQIEEGVERMKKALAFS